MSRFFVAWIGLDLKKRSRDCLAGIQAKPLLFPPFICHLNFFKKDIKSS